MTAQPPVKQRRKRLLPPAFVSAILSGHTVLGLATSALIYLICLSGTISVFSQELRRWEQPAGPVVRAATPGALDRGLSEIFAKTAEEKSSAISVVLPSDDLPRLILKGGSADHGGNQWLADSEGRAVVMQHHPATDFLVELHGLLHLPEIAGLTVVGLIGMALFTLLISGILAHPQMFKEAFTLRWGGSRRLQEADLHNRLGTWGLPFHLMVTLTGTALGAFLLMFGGMAATVYKGDFRSALTDILGPVEMPEGAAAATSLPRIGPALAYVEADAPSARIRAVEIGQPGTTKQTISIMIDEPGELLDGQRYLFDASGHLIYSSRAHGTSVGRQALFSLKSLHFGWFGGFATKFAYGVLGLSLCAITSSGMRIWFARRRDRGRPVPTWERVWTATIWGQPSAFAMSAILSTFWSHDNATAIGWIAVTLLSYIAACIIRDDRRLSAALRVSAAVQIILLGVIHASGRVGQSEDVVAWIVDAALIAGGATLIGWSLRHRKIWSVGPAHIPHSEARGAND